MTGLLYWRTPRLTEPRTVLVNRRAADVLAGICHGHTNAQIAARLHLHEDTVKTHVRTVLALLGADNRAHAAALACSGQVTVTVRDRP